MEDVLDCPVCVSRYNAQANRPLLLPACGHTLCRQCASRLASCPECRHSIDCPVEALPTNVVLLRTADASGQGPLHDMLDNLSLNSDVPVLPGSDVELLECVGTGGSGQVWTARFRGRLVAVKVFGTSLPGTPTGTSGSQAPGSPGSADGPQSPARAFAASPLLQAFLREVSVLAVVSAESHYCVRLLGVTVKGDKPCIIMRWYPAGHLRIPAVGFDLATALSWGASVAKALADVHALGIVVADLKPENVLVTAVQDCILADFGISRRVTQTLANYTSSTTAGNVQGTLNYMAPEQFRTSRITNRADMWALGCMMLQLLTGRVPWAGLNIAQVMTKVVVEKATPQVPQDLPHGLMDLLQRCFSFEPTERPSAMQFLQEIRANSPAWVVAALSAAPSTPEPQGATAGRRSSSDRSSDLEMRSEPEPEATAPPLRRQPPAESCVPALLAQLGGSDAEQCEAAKGLWAATSDDGEPGAAARLFAEGGVPQLLRLLGSSNAELLSCATAALGNVAIDVPDSRISMVPAAPQLVQLLSSPDAMLQRFVVGVLESLTDIPGAAGKDAVAAAGGVLPIIGLLRSNEETTLRRAAGALWSLAGGDVGAARDAACQAILQHGIDSLVRLLRHPAGCVQRLAAGVIGHVADSTTAAHTIRQAGAVAPLAVLLAADEPGTVASAVASLGNLCRDPLCALQARQAGAVRPCIRLLAADAFTARCAAGLLESISDFDEAARGDMIEQGVLPPLVALLASDDAVTVYRASGALWSLSIGSTLNKVAIRDSGAIHALLALCGRDGESRERAVATLGNVAAAGAAAGAAIRAAGGIPRLVGLLEPGAGSARVQAYALGCLEHMADDDEPSRAAIAASGGLPAIVGLLAAADLETSRRAAGTLWSVSLAGPAAKETICEAGGIPALVRLLRFADVDLRRRAAAALGNVASAAPRWSKAVREVGGVAPLVGLLTHSDPVLPRFAAGVLAVITLHDERSRREAYEAGAAGPLLRLLEADNDEDAQHRAAIALHNIMELIRSEP